MRDPARIVDIFSLPGWIPKASIRMPFCFAKRHSRVIIRKRTFWYTNLSVEGPFWSHFRCEGNGTAARTTTLLLQQTLLPRNIATSLLRKEVAAPATARTRVRAR
eukprot:sb/3478011/